MAETKTLLTTEVDRLETMLNSNITMLDKNNILNAQEILLLNTSEIINANVTNSIINSRNNN